MRCQVPVDEEDSLFFANDPIVKAIRNTSAGDMLLFMIALNRKEREEKGLDTKTDSSDAGSR